MAGPTVLLVSPDDGVRARIGKAFEGHGARTLRAGDAAGALAFLRTHAPDVIVVERGAPGVEATGLLEAARRLRPTAPVVLVGDVPSGEGPVAEGVFDAVDADADVSALRLVAQRCLRHHEVLGACARLRERLRGIAGHDALVGASPSMDRLREELRRLTMSDAPVLFVGEPGSGRELAARTLHAGSDLRELPFEILDCRRSRPELLERELFESGVGESGARLPHRERVLFLDDIVELADPIQRQLEQRLALAAAGLAVPPATRLLAACVADPRAALDQGRLSVELFRRMAATTIRVPALRDRREDISLLASRFIEELRDINALPPVRITPEALTALEAYHWPGNVRELRNVIEEAVVVAEEGRIEPRHLPERVLRESRLEAGGAPRAAGAVLFKEAKREVVDDFERRYLRNLLEAHRGNVTAAAQSAGMLRSALQRLLRKHGIRSAPFRRRLPARD